MPLLFMGRNPIDALIARTPAQHEHLAWELRRQILAARDMGRIDGSEDRFQRALPAGITG